jgi:hypothetical protein
LRFEGGSLRAIVDRISATAPNVTDATRRKELEVKTSRPSLRPGDAVLFAAGALFLLVAILQWLQKLSIAL